MVNRVVTSDLRLNSKQIANRDLEIRQLTNGNQQCLNSGQMASKHPSSFVVSGVYVRSDLNSAFSKCSRLSTSIGLPHSILFPLGMTFMNFHTWLAFWWLPEH
jgi:hypothetical protein